jgi:hypothetical protein
LLPNQPDDDAQSLEMFSTMKKQIEELNKERSQAGDQFFENTVKVKSAEIRKMRHMKKPTAANDLTNSQGRRQSKDAALKTTIVELSTNMSTRCGSPG